MKFVCIFLLLSSTLYAQDLKFSLDSINRTGYTFNGTISTDIPITFYIEAVEFYDAGKYTVKGWYYYDKVKISIPLVGFTDEQSLVLYNFKDQKSADSVLKMLVPKGEDVDMWSMIETLQNKTNFQEKFFYEFGSEKGFWTNNKRQLDVVFSNLKYAGFYSTEQFLNVTSGKEKFNYSLLNLFHEGGFKIEKSAKVGTKHKVYLSYESPSKGGFYANGFCGGGVNAGVVFLEFDEKGAINNFKHFETENCYENKYVTTDKKNADGTISYFVFQENSEDGSTIETELIVDPKNFTFTTKILPSSEK